MPTFEVDVDGATYEVDAPDENTAYQWASSEHQSQATQQPVEDAGLLARISESITGKARSTPEIEALPDWRGNMPEFSLSQGIPALKTSLGTMFADAPFADGKTFHDVFWKHFPIKKDECDKFLDKIGRAHV
jgi:hypothetical protein